MAPPSLFDYIISRGLADGICIAGCAERECHFRLGKEWTRQRIARNRDPMLRERVPRERLKVVWVGPSEALRLDRGLAAFVAELVAQPAFDKARPLGEDERAAALAVGPLTETTQ
jgi:coenzyme F420-reducing hydrogenase delta subunit